MCEKHLSLETKLETAVNIVKKAYSEVPSFDALLDALLSVPLEELHKACTLTPGIPVVPMLAKPTKSVLEVLKRLNGLRFTCEYKYDGERAQVHMTPDGVTKVIDFCQSIQSKVSFAKSQVPSCCDQLGILPKPPQHL